MSRSLGSAAISLREATDQDGPGVLLVLQQVYAEFEGCVFDLDEVRPLQTPHSSYSELDGRLWVAHDDRQIVGFSAGAPDRTAPGRYELKKLYLLSGQRGTGLGRKLIERIEHDARERGFSRMMLWTDTRFHTAHRVYERVGYERLPGERPLHDKSRSMEYQYIKTLCP